MNLNLENKLFFVGGATAGFGGAIARALLAEGAQVLAVARNADKLAAFSKEFPTKVETINGDITQSATLDAIVHKVSSRSIHGLVLNAGGPPPTAAADTTMQQWDDAWLSVARWKIELVSRLLPQMRKENYGRILFIESISVKQPIQNLVLSNALRLAVAGYAKTLAGEVAKEGITVNIMAPGYHATDAVKRVVKKRSETSGISEQQAQQQIIQHIPVGRMGQPEEFAALAAWLLSPQSAYITGQTISVDGGVMQGIFG
ncbi:MAG: SDR family oxidoreductase [Bacteroidales bacterium]|jgi:3-oxoacyl-[acyl-carrier protein] reductase|nr:SDR family oxidoreductase [Bacteroidales bacterium]